MPPAAVGRRRTGTTASSTRETRPGTRQGPASGRRVRQSEARLQQPRQRAARPAPRSWIRVLRGGRLPYGPAGLDRRCRSPKKLPPPSPAGPVESRTRKRAFAVTRGPRMRTLWRTRDARRPSLDTQIGPCRSLPTHTPTCAAAEGPTATPKRPWCGFRRPCPSPLEAIPRGLRYALCRLGVSGKRSSVAKAE